MRRRISGGRPLSGPWRGRGRSPQRTVRGRGARSGDGMGRHPAASAMARGSAVYTRSPGRARPSPRGPVARPDPSIGAQLRCRRLPYRPWPCSCSLRDARRLRRLRPPEQRPSQLAFGVAWPSAACGARPSSASTRPSGWTPRTRTCRTTWGSPTRPPASSTRRSSTTRRRSGSPPTDRQLKDNYARFVEFYQSFRPKQDNDQGRGAPAPPATPAAGGARRDRRPAAAPGRSGAPPSRTPPAGARRSEDQGRAGRTIPPSPAAGRLRAVALRRAAAPGIHAQGGVRA